MTDLNVNTLLLLNSNSSSYSFSFLFHCARHWAQQGNRVLFISKSPVRTLPHTIGQTDATFNPDEFKLIQFMYLSNWQELLHQLYSIHLRRKPVSALILNNLEAYLEEKLDHDHVSLICASLIYASSVCSKLTSQSTILITNYISEDGTILKNIIKNFFTNIWMIRKEDAVTFSKVSPSENDEFVQFKFEENEDTLKLSFSEIVKKIIS